MKSDYRYDDGLFHVTEIFDSIDGEGKRTGCMAIFVRLAGCNLRCTYCDTAYSLELSDTKEALTEDELIRRIHAFPWKNITLTGGEPMLHPLRHLCERLSEEGYDINIETNGAVPLWEDRPSGVFYTMDFKCSGSGMKESMRKENFPILKEKDVLKFVVGSKEDLDEMKENRLSRVRVQVQLHKIIWDPNRRGV